MANAEMSEADRELVKEMLPVMVAFGIAFLLAVTIVAMNLTGYIDCPWVWVSFPIVAWLIGILVGAIALDLVDMAAWDRKMRKEYP